MFSSISPSVPVNINKKSEKLQTAYPDRAGALLSKGAASAVMAMNSPAFCGIIIDISSKTGQNVPREPIVKFRQTPGSAFNLRKSSRHDVMIHTMALPADTDTKIPDDILPLLKRAEEIAGNVGPILERFKPLYNNCTNDIRFFEEVYDKEGYSNSERKVVLTKYDDFNEPLKRAFFCDGRLWMIKDYKNSRIILCDRDTGTPAQKFDVFLGCKDMDDDNAIKSDETFTFSSGSLARYSKDCLEYIDSSYFYADEVYTFKSNFFEGYDKSFNISCGAEYSNEFFKFDMRPGVDYYELEGNVTPVKYVQNKISVKGVIIHSTSETDLKKM